jgi:large subunit ribosomal protein L18
MRSTKEKYNFRKSRVRKKLFMDGFKYPRLAVYRSLKYLYAQVVSDSESKTLVSATTLSKELKDKFTKSGKSIEAAKALGELIAKKALDAGIKQVCFDRGGRIYHGRIKALADSARKAGLKF